MTFEQQFRSWMETNVPETIPPAVQAFAFNLFEPASIPGVKFGIELVGAGEFDETDADWPCAEVWEPPQRQLPIPLTFSGEDWDQCLEQVTNTIVRFLAEPSRAAKLLRSRAAVGLGFVDGDLALVWKA